MENKHPLLLWEEVSTTRRNMEYLQKIAKIYEDFKKFFFLQVLDKWIALSFALRNRSPKQIPHNAATKYIP